MNMKEAFEYFDKKRIKYDSLTNNNLIFKIERPTHDMDNTKYELILNNKVMANGICHLIGSYYNELSLWQWAWSIATESKSKNYMSRKILMSAFETDNDDDNKYNSAIFKTSLITSKLYIEHENIEILNYMSMAMYLTKAEWYIKSEAVNGVNNDIIGNYYYTLQTVNIL